MPYQVVQLSSLLTSLANKYEIQPFWTPDNARRAINEGLRIWNLITGTWRVSVNLLTIPNDAHLAIGGTLIRGCRVTVGGNVLIQGSVFGFDQAIPNWQGVNTKTGGTTPPVVSYWAPIGLTEIMIYPPDAPPARTPVVVDAVRSTAVLVNNTDYLDLGIEEMSTLLGYALHVLTFAKGIDTLRETLTLKQAFYKAAARRNNVFAASSMYRKVAGYDMLRAAVPIERVMTAVQQAMLRASDKGEAGRPQGGGGLSAGDMNPGMRDDGEGG